MASNPLLEASTLRRWPGLVAQRTALLVIDMVNWQVADEGALVRWSRQMGVDTSYLSERVEQRVKPNIAALAARCRQVGATVVYLRIGCRRADHRDAVPGLRGLCAAADARDGTWSCAVVDELAPEPGDVSLIKTGSSSFLTSDLHATLTGRGITTLVHTGVMTDACVLNTVFGAWDLGYEGRLVRDATATWDDDRQAAAERILHGTAKLTTTAEVLTELAPIAG
jgi:nicotinamidase-related amidase